MIQFWRKPAQVVSLLLMGILKASDQSSWKFLSQAISVLPSWGLSAQMLLVSDMEGDCLLSQRSWPQKTPWTSVQVEMPRDGHPRHCWEFLLPNSFHTNVNIFCGWHMILEEWNKLRSPRELAIISTFFIPRISPGGGAIFCYKVLFVLLLCLLGCHGGH